MTQAVPAEPTRQVRALTWPTHRTLSRLEAWCGTALATWAQKWGVRLGRVTCLPAAQAIREDGAGQGIQWVERPVDSTSSFWVGAPGCDPEVAMAELLFSRSDGPRAPSPLGGVIVREVARDALEALLAAFETAMDTTAPGRGELEGRGGNVSPLPRRSPPLKDLRPWSGSVRLALWVPDIAQPILSIHLPALLLDRFLPKTAGVVAAVHTGIRLRAPVCPLPLALREHGVRLQARLADLPLTLGLLTTLRQGDVLVSQHRLELPLHVWAQGSSGASREGEVSSPHPLLGDRATEEPRLFSLPFATGRLVQREGRMAVSLGPATNEKPLETSRSFGSAEMTASNHPPQQDVQWLELPEASSPSASAPKLPATSSPLLGIKATVQVCVGEAVVSVKQLTESRVGQVIPLDREVDGVVDLLLNGQVVARGHLVAVGDNFGISLTELPEPLGSLGGIDGGPVAGTGVAKA